MRGGPSGRMRRERIRCALEPEGQRSIHVPLGQTHHKPSASTKPGHWFSVMDVSEKIPRVVSPNSCFSSIIGSYSLCHMPSRQSTLSTMSRKSMLYFLQIRLKGDIISRRLLMSGVPVTQRRWSQLRRRKVLLNIPSSRRAICASSTISMAYRISPSCLWVNLYWTRLPSGWILLLSFVENLRRFPRNPGNLSMGILPPSSGDPAAF